MFLKKLTNFFYFFLIFLFTKDLFAQNLYFAGFSFMGNANQDFRYPVAIELYNQNNLVFKDPLDNSLEKPHK